MVRLFLLGNTECLREDGTGVPTLVRSPKRLALLAYLAVAEPTGFHRRDTLIGLLWPEFDQQRARTNLRQTLKRLKAEVGDAVVTRGREEVGLDRDAFWSDVVEFRNRMTHEWLEEAMALYRGDMLAGFYLRGRPGLERWLDNQRMRLRTQASGACWSLAARQADDAQARTWAQRGGSLVPYDEAALRRLLGFLRDRGDRAGALHEYERFAERVGKDLGVEPDERTKELARELRRTQGVRAPRSGGSEPSPAMHSSSWVARDAPPSSLIESVPAATEASETAAPPNPWGARRLRYAVLVVVTMLAMGLGRVFRGGGAEESWATPVRLTVQKGIEAYPALSPDGRSLIHSEGTARDLRLMLRSLDRGTVTPIADDVPGVQHSAAWSGDGKRIAFLATESDRTTLYVASASGGAPDAVHGSSNELSARGPSWSPDGLFLAFAVGNEIFKLELASGALTVVAEGHDLHSTAWSPDGQWIAFVEENIGFSALGKLGNNGPSGIRVARASGGASHWLIPRDGLNTRPVWVGSQELWFLSDRDGPVDLYRIGLDTSGQASGPAKRIATGLNLVDFDASPSGRVALAALEHRSNLHVVALPDSGLVKLSKARAITSGDQVIETLRLSPDHRWIAFDSNRDGGSDQDLYILSTDGGEPRRLTADPADEFSPSFSPDGKRVVYYAYREQGSELLIRGVDGGDGVRPTDEEHRHAHPHWSPDGDAIVFQSITTGAEYPTLKVIEREAHGSWAPPREIWSRYGHNPLWSPDGGWVLFGTDRDSRVIRRDGGPSTVVFDGPYGGQWAPDGRFLFFLSDRLGTRERAIWRVPFEDGEVGEPRAVAEGAEEVGAFDLDGERFFFTRIEQNADLWLMTSVDALRSARLPSAR